MSDVAYIPLQDTYKPLRMRLVSVGGRDVLMYYDVLSDVDGVALKTVDSKLRTSSVPYTYDIAEGNVSDHYAVRRFGHNNDVGASWETVFHDSSLYQYLSAAERLQVASTDVDDDGAPVGDGARTLFIQGLDTNYEIINETITLDGQTNVLTDESYLRVFKARVETAGTTGTNEGTITVNDNGDAFSLSVIEAGEGESHEAIYTVPADNTLYITQWCGSELTNKGVHFGLFIRQLGKAWLMKRLEIVTQDQFCQQYHLPLKLPEKTDIEIRAYGTAVAGEVTASFEGWREPT